MQASHVKESLSAYIDDQLSAAERASINEHLGTCEECRRHLESLRKTVTLVQSGDPIRAPEGFGAQVRARVEQAARQTSFAPRWPHLRWSWRTAGAVAAVLLIGVFSFNLLLRDRSLSLRSVPREQTGEVGDATRVPPAASVGKSSPAAGVPRAEIPQVSQRIGTEAVAPSLRRVIRTAQLSVEVEQFNVASRRLLAIAEAAGGFVADSSYAETDGILSGTFVLRVPAPRFNAVVDQVEKIGTVLQRRISGQDVTEEYVDLQARVRNLERHEQSLLAFMDRASKVSDLLAIEQELARVRGGIEQLTGRMRYLDHHVDLATIEIAAREKAKKTSGAIWDFSGTIGKMRAAFVATIRQILAAVEKLAVMASALAPVLLVATAAWLLMKRIRTREA